MSENLIVINADFGETRVAVVENGIIVELLLERRNERSIVGNIYQGKVTRVLPGMQAAFVDIGLERHAFLHVSDLIHQEDYDLFGDNNGSTQEDGLENGRVRRVSKNTPIRDIIQEGKTIIVQVSKGPISTKGARVTAHVSMPGRHLVYMPTSDRGGVSRRILDDKERRRLIKVLKRITPSNGALIARTAAEGVSADALAADADYLAEIWNSVISQNNKNKKPRLLYEELDLPVRTARDRLTDSVAELVIDDKGYFDKVHEYVDRLIPSRLDAIKLYEGDEPIFDEFGIESEIRRALDRRVELPSGGSLIIDQAEALTAIDVNTGKFVGKGSRDQEDTILTTNLEAVDEIVYQLRFRNIGGLIVLDLIDMDRPNSRRKVLDRLKEVLAEDRAKASVIKISQFGLVEMTRERTSDSLGRTLHEPCDHCDGTGQILSRVTVANEALRDVRRRSDEFLGDIELVVHPNVAEVFKTTGIEPLKELQKRIGKKVVLSIDKNAHQEHFQVRTRRLGRPGKEGQ
ncbi:MAG: Rne/Rng family ribonuclease [Proteobacteria bacterium]|nr:Rne/Rng family ribonuclease [Pseudomonadota bacterium]